MKIQVKVNHMVKIKTINNISPACRSILDPKKYEVGEDFINPEVIFVRASSLLDYPFGDRLLCVARAGIGVNTIPLDALAEPPAATPTASRSCS